MSISPSLLNRLVFHRHLKPLLPARVTEYTRREERGAFFRNVSPSIPFTTGRRLWIQYCLCDSVQRRYRKARAHKGILFWHPITDLGRANKYGAADPLRDGSL